MPGQRFFYDAEGKYLGSHTGTNDTLPGFLKVEGAVEGGEPPASTSPDEDGVPVKIGAIEELLIDKGLVTRREITDKQSEIQSRGRTEDIQAPEPEEGR